MAETTATTEDDLFLSLHPGSLHPGSLHPRTGTTTCAPGAGHDPDRSDDLPGAPLLRPQRILVAGDDVATVADLVDVVSSPWREVHSATCSDLALELALQLHFDLVVLHVDRPDAGGLEVSHCIRTCHELAQPTIVVISRPCDEDTWARAVDSRADLVLREPARIFDLTGALDPLLQG